MTRKKLWRFLAKLLSNALNENLFFHLSFNKSRINLNPVILMFRNAMRSLGYDDEKTSALNVSELFDDFLITS